MFNMPAEKIEFENSRGMILSGVLHMPKGGTESMVIIAHGFTENKDRKRLVDVANALEKNGIAALRYDCGGSGESADAKITVTNYLDDCWSAIDQARDREMKFIGLLGESLGGLSSAMAYTSDIASIVLWAPVTTNSMPSMYGKEKVMQDISNTGFHYFQKDGKEFKIPQEYFDNRKLVDQQKLMSSIKCATLILHGDKDDSVQLEGSQSALQYLPEGSKLEVIKGASHYMADSNSKVIPLTVKWFKEKFK
jgi:alpha-beta hydrolase superfamily lysophospholipase